MAVTPETGAEPVTSPNGAARTTDGFTQVKGGLMSEEEAVARIAGMLGTEQTSEESSGGEREEPEEREQEAADETDQEDRESETEETDETEPKDDAEEELPDTLETLAEALEMKPEDLAEHLKVPIKVNGKMSEVTLEEAIRGYQREQDYSRRTEEVAAQRRQMADQAQAFETERKQQLEGLGVLHQALSQRVAGYTEEVLMQIYQQHGQEAYMQAKMQQEHDLKLLDGVKAQGEQLTQERQKKLGEFRAEQQRLLQEADPDFRDMEKGRKAQDEMATYLKGKSFSDGEIAEWFNGPFDARHVQVIRDAAKYRALMEKSKTVGKTVPKTKPKLKKAGSGVDHTPPNKLSSLRQRVRKSRGGSRSEQRDASVDLISAMIRGK